MRATIVYYSLEGNIATAVRYLGEKLVQHGVDVQYTELKTAKPYPKKGLAKFLFGGKDASFGRTPELAPYDFDDTSSDLVILALPVWAGKAAAPINSFLRTHSLRGDRVALMIASASGDASSCAKDVAGKLGRAVTALPTLSLKNPGKLPKDELGQALDGFAAQLAEAPQGGGGAF